MKILINLLISILLCFTYQTAEAGYCLKHGRLVDEATVATMSAKEHFAAGLQAIEDLDWGEAAKQFNIVVVNFPGTESGKEAYFYLGAADFHIKEYDFANQAFSNYLQVNSNPQFFQEAVEYKFAIANCLAKGEKKRIFGKKVLPKWACGKQLAIKIYDEVIAAMPSNDTAAQAMLSKGRLFWRLKDYRAAIESFNLAVRRFPKHELAADSYVMISQVYLEQSQQEYQNTDILALAQINLRKFARDFPREERLCEVENNLAAIKEIHARGLYETGKFYERTHNPEAAVIYYRIAIHQFPETVIAAYCKSRLSCLDSPVCHVQRQEDELENPAQLLPDQKLPAS